MNDPQAKAAELLRLGDNQFLTLDASGLHALKMRMYDVLNTGKPDAGLIALGAPSHVPAHQTENEAGKLPALVGLHYSLQREWEANFKQNILLVVSNLTDGRLHAGPASEHKRRRQPAPSRSGPAPSASEASAMLTDLDQRNLIDLTGPIRGPARLVVTALYLDWKSNSIVIDVEGPNAVQPAAPAATATSVAQPLAGASPAAPTASGINVAVPPTAVAGQPLVLRASASVPVAMAGLQLAAGEATPTHLPVTALLVSRDQPKPIRFSFSVRSQVVAEGGAPAQARAAFQFDLNQAMGAVLLAGDYQLYLVVGGLIAGPHPINLRS